MTRQAAAYRNDRILLAGDAAHIHAPLGGQGLNLGVQDAVNLGWKLGEVLNGASLVDLLDTYYAERHPVAARVLQNTMAQRAVAANDERTVALKNVLGDLLKMDEPRKHIAAMIAGLDITYDLGGEHPLVGRRIPDLDLQTASGPVRTFELLHAAKPILINFENTGPEKATIQQIDAIYEGPWELPVIGEVPAPPAVLVRPDGYVAWVAGHLDRSCRVDEARVY